MKKAIITTSLLFLVIIMIPVVLICFAFGLPAQYDQSFYGGMNIKYNRLKSIKDNKVVVIGGSSVAFGLRSDLMEEEIGMPVVNFGLYANLGTKYMLDVAEDFIKKDDIVIIAPEQNEQALSLYFNGEAVWYSADGRFDILQKIDSTNAGDMAKSFLKFTSGKFGCWQDGEKPCPEGVYNVNSFDKYGDIKYQRPYNTMPDGYDTGMMISFNKKTVSQEFITYLNSYAKRLYGKGATLFYSFCPMNDKAIVADTNEDDIKTYYDYLVSQLDFTVIGNPDAHLLDSDWFYDTNFHLNDAGAVYYTSLLAQEIKAELGDYKPITSVVPDKPQKPTQDGVGGTISQDLEEAAKIFTLGGVEVITDGDKVELKGNWTVKGLTEYGKTLSEIVIPDTLAGLPVTALGSKCFADATVLNKIVFGKNISSVQEDAFDGCEGLTAIYITSLNPETYIVSPTILDNLENCYFYVPEEVYTDYKFNYNWTYIDIKRPLKKY